MIDNDGYRLNVCIVICNKKWQVLWDKRYGQDSWQFPQGGIDVTESPEETRYRKLFKQLWLNKKDVRILTSTPYWLSYKLSKHLVRWNTDSVCIGQKQQ